VKNPEKMWLQTYASHLAPFVSFPPLVMATAPSQPLLSNLDLMTQLHEQLDHVRPVDITSAFPRSVRNSETTAVIPQWLGGIILAVQATTVMSVGSVCVKL
jgi:hypothetical protein